MTNSLHESLDYEWSSFSDLSNEDVYEILCLRQNIFIVEQECWYQDADGKDKEALHLSVKNQGNLIGCQTSYLNLARYSENLEGQDLGK